MSTYQSDVGERDRNMIDVHYIVGKYVHPHEDLVELNSHTSNTCQISKSIYRRGRGREGEREGSRRGRGYKAISALACTRK